MRASSATRPEREVPKSFWYTGRFLAACPWLGLFLLAVMSLSRFDGSAPGNDTAGLLPLSLIFLAPTYGSTFWSALAWQELRFSWRLARRLPLLDQGALFLNTGFGCLAAVPWFGLLWTFASLLFSTFQAYASLPGH